MKYYLIVAVLIFDTRVSGESEDRFRRIVNGIQVPINDYRYMVYVYARDLGICSGSIISDDCVLTAAHCANGTKKIFSGSSNRFKGKKNLVDSIHYAPNGGDIAILKVKDHFVESENTTVIRLRDKNYTATAGTLGIVSGWGKLSEYSDDVPDEMMAIEVPIVDRNKCLISYGDSYLNNTKICAGFFDDGDKDSCKGDSGSPLVIANHLYAIVSKGRGCARPKYPGVYEKISFYVDWIEKLCSVDSYLPAQ